MSIQDQPEDTHADEEQPAEAAPDEPGVAKEPSEDERLEEIGERIDAARKKAEDAGVIVDEDENEETFADSGATEEEDDQTIAPPG